MGSGLTTARRLPKAKAITTLSTNSDDSVATAAVPSLAVPPAITASTPLLKQNTHNNGSNEDVGDEVTVSVSAVKPSLRNAKTEVTIGGRATTGSTITPSIHTHKPFGQRPQSVITVPSSPQTETHNNRSNEVLGGVAVVSAATPSLRNTATDVVVGGTAAASPSVHTYKPSKFKEGEVVELLYGDDRPGHWFIARITAVRTNGTYLVTPNVGEAEDNVQENELRPQRILRRGDIVMVFQRNDHWERARITHVKKNQCYDIQYDDLSTEMDISIEDMYRVKSQERTASHGTNGLTTKLGKGQPVQCSPNQKATRKHKQITQKKKQKQKQKQKQKKQKKLERDRFIPTQHTDNAPLALLTHMILWS